MQFCILCTKENGNNTYHWSGCPRLQSELEYIEEIKPFTLEDWEQLKVRLTDKKGNVIDTTTDLRENKDE